MKHFILLLSLQVAVPIIDYNLRKGTDREIEASGIVLFLIGLLTCTVHYHYYRSETELSILVNTNEEKKTATTTIPGKFFEVALWVSACASAFLLSLIENSNDTITATEQDSKTLAKYFIYASAAIRCKHVLIAPYHAVTKYCRTKKEQEMAQPEVRDYLTLVQHAYYITSAIIINKQGLEPGNASSILFLGALWNMVDGFTGILDIHSLVCHATSRSDPTNSTLSELLIKINSAVMNTWMLSKAVFLCATGQPYQLADFFLFCISMLIGAQTALLDLLSPPIHEAKKTPITDEENSLKYGSV